MRQTKRGGIQPKPPTSAPTGPAPVPPSTPPTTVTNGEIQKALEGMLHIAEMAMPDSYFQSDSRVKRAQKLLKKVSKE